MPRTLPTWVATSTAALTALVAAFALVLQYVLLERNLAAGGMSPLAALWRFLGFFTILTNLLVLVVAGAMALAPRSALAGPKLRLAAVTSIVMVGAVYSLALRHIWNPQGWQAVADHLLHDATPPLFLLAWIAAGHGALAWRNVNAAIAPALAYCAYALARGAGDGWYAYWFFDPTRLTRMQMLTHFTVLLAAFALAGGIFIFADRFLSRRAA